MKPPLAGHEPTGAGSPVCMYEGRAATGGPRCCWNGDAEWVGYLVVKEAFVYLPGTYST